MAKKQMIFWALTITYGAAGMLPILLSEGTFFDGMIYAVLARNLAAGVGSFWAPHFSLTSQAQWFEHPPLGLNIASLFYRVLGEGVWVEHAYSLFTVLVCSGLIIVLWKQVVPDGRRLRRLAWLPVLFWFMNPQVTWAYANNMLENTMSIFTLGAVILLLRSCRDGKRWALYLLLGAVAVVAAVLTKGLVGLFPLVTLGAYQLGTRRLGWRRTAGRTLLLVTGAAALMALVMTIPAARYNIARYLETQLLPSMSGQRTDTGNPFIYLVKLLNTLLPALVVALAITLAGWRKRLLSGVTADHMRWALTFLLLALAGSVPLMVSPRRSMFYVLPSFPFYAIATALPVAAITSDLIERLRDGSRLLRGWQIAAGLLLAAVAVFSASRIGTYNRSEIMVRDVKAIGSYLQSELGLAVDQEYAVGACRRLWRNWNLETNLARYHRLGLAHNDSTMTFVVTDDLCAEELDATYVRVALETNRYHLYVRRDAEPAERTGDPDGGL